MSSRSSGEVWRRATRLLLLVATPLMVLFFAPRAEAYPFMIMHGYAKCGSCHTDPMGGETLTSFGRVMSDTTLSTRWDGSRDPTNKAKLFFGLTEPRALRLGGSVRYMDAYFKFPQNGAKGEYRQFPMQADVYGQVTLADRLRIAGSVGAAKVREGSSFSRAAQVTSAPDGQLNLVSRSHWVGYDVSDSVLVRAGRMNLPFGLRIPEHVMWARVATRTDRESHQQHGVAASYSSGRLRGELMAILGNYQVRPDRFRERGYSLNAEYLLGLRSAIGVSSLVTHAEEDRLLVNGKPMTRQAHGLTGRVSPVNHLALLAEADVLASSQTSLGYVGVVQADYEIVQGVHAMATGELVDAGKASGTTATRGAGDPMMGAWVSAAWYFFTHFDARVDLVLRQGAPPSIQSQLHYYF